METPDVGVPPGLEVRSFTFPAEAAEHVVSAQTGSPFLFADNGKGQTIDVFYSYNPELDVPEIEFTIAIEKKFVKDERQYLGKAKGFHVFVS